MNIEVIRQINQIIQRDSKDTSYKFALLRAVIDSLQEYGHYKEVFEDRAKLKTGLLTFYWIKYYYPIIASEEFVSQKKGETESIHQLAFRSSFKSVAEHYKANGGLSVLINDLIKGQIDSQIQTKMIQLVGEITSTITKQPMRYIGKSAFNREYSIFTSEGGRKPIKGEISLATIIEKSGSYTIPLEYSTVFEYLGGIITGRNSILIEWANFTSRRNNLLKPEYVLEKLLTEPVDDRDVGLISKVIKEEIQSAKCVRCIWSDKKVTEKNLNIDHVLPFAIWRNNDLWNLIPVDKGINSKKSDKIPTPELVINRRESIKEIWGLIREKAPVVFDQSIETGLIGSKVSEHQFFDKAIESLADKCQFLIEKRGLPHWEYQ